MALRLVLPLALLFFCPLQYSDGSDNGGDHDHEKDKYREPASWIQYKKLIDDAMTVDDEAGCRTEGASCYFDVIDADLKTWEKGITRDKFQEGLDQRSQTRATHYQIIDHKYV